MAEQRDYGNIINPVSARYTFTQDKVVEGTFSYSNAFFSDSPEQQTFITYVGFIYQIDGVPVVYTIAPKELGSFDMSSWISVKEKEFTLEKGKTQVIHYSITPPHNPQQGGKYAVIIVLPKEKSSELIGSGSIVNASIGFPIIGRVGGTEVINSEIVSFDSDKSIYFEWPKQPIKFTTVLKNNGNVDYLPGGDIFIHQGDIKHAIHEETINDTDLVVLPNNTRTFNNIWTSKEPLIKFSDNGVFFNLDYFRIGKYTATAKIGYDIEGKRVVANREVSFWILPMPLIVAILTVILVSSVGIIIWKRRKKRLQKLADKKNTTS